MSSLPQVPEAQPKARQLAVVSDTSDFANLLDSAKFEHLQRIAAMFANSTLVPDHFKGKAADCAIAVEMALRLKVHPFNLMQSLYVVHGKPGIEAKMCIALINSSGIFQAPLQFKLEGEGMKRSCTAIATHKGSRQICETTVTMEMAKAEGWIDKSGSKWKTIPDLMLQYRSASFFGRLYCPEVIFGMQTREELIDTAPEVDVTPPAPERPAAPTLRDRMGIVDAEPVAAKASAPEQELAASAEKGRPMPLTQLLTLAKKAANDDQRDILRDMLRHESYSDEDRAQVEKVLKGEK